MAIADVLAAATVRPVHIGSLDFKDDPVRGWTGPGTLAPTGTGDPDLDGDTFDQAAGIINVSGFSDDTGIGDPITLTFAAGEMTDESIITQIVADRRAFQGRRARFWLAFLNAAESAILPEIEPLFTGVMISAQTSRQPGQPSTIQIECDQDTQKAQGPPLRYADHQVFNTGDTASSFLVDLARGGVAGADRTSGGPIARPNPGTWTYDNWG